MQKSYICSLIFSLAVLTLSILPASALTGQVDNTMQIGQAICINTTRNQTSTIGQTGSSFDCGASFTPASGDQITLILIGTGSGGTNPPEPPVPPQPGSCTATPIQETTGPNDDFPESQDIGTLNTGGCIEVAGNVDVGFGDPNAPDDANADFDYYVFSPVGVSRVRIDFTLATAEVLRYAAFDANTQTSLPDIGPPEAIEVAVTPQIQRIVIRVSTDSPSDYILSLSDSSSSAFTSSINNRPRKLQEVD